MMHVGMRGTKIGLPQEPIVRERVATLRVVSRTGTTPTSATTVVICAHATHLVPSYLVPQERSVAIGD